MITITYWDLREPIAPRDRVHAGFTPFFAFLQLLLLDQLECGLLSDLMPRRRILVECILLFCSFPQFHEYQFSQQYPLHFLRISILLSGLFWLLSSCLLLFLSSTKLIPLFALLALTNQVQPEDFRKPSSTKEYSSYSKPRSIYIILFISHKVSYFIIILIDLYRRNLLLDVINPLYSLEKVLKPHQHPQ